MSCPGTDRTCRHCARIHVQRHAPSIHDSAAAYTGSCNTPPTDCCYGEGTALLSHAPRMVTYAGVKVTYAGMQGCCAVALLHMCPCHTPISHLVVMALPAPPSTSNVWYNRAHLVSLIVRLAPLGAGHVGADPVGWGMSGGRDRAGRGGGGKGMECRWVTFGGGALGWQDVGQ